MLKRLLIYVAVPFALLVAGAASAVPISMTPGSVDIDTVFGQGNHFTLTFDGGDTSNNILDFTVQGGGGAGFMGFAPSTALAAIVFTGTDIIDAGDSASGFLNPNNVVRGLSIPGYGVAAALLVDTFAPSSESFWLELESTPTFATVMSLNVGNLALSRGSNVSNLFMHAVDAKQVSFVAAVPEPSAALVFGVGLLVTGSAIRRQR